MAFELTITAPFSFSFCVSSRQLSVFWGLRDAGFVLAAADFPHAGSKLVTTWRNPICNSLNMEAFGLHLVASKGV